MFDCICIVVWASSYKDDIKIESRKIRENDEFTTFGVIETNKTAFFPAKIQTIDFLINIHRFLLLKFGCVDRKKIRTKQAYFPEKYVFRLISCNSAQKIG